MPISRWTNFDENDPVTRGGLVASAVVNSIAGPTILGGKDEGRAEQCKGGEEKAGKRHGRGESAA